MSGTQEDELPTSVLWPPQVRTTVARQTWRLAVYDVGLARTHAARADGRRGALSVPRWVNTILASVAAARPTWEGLAVVVAAARLLRDVPEREAVRAAWALGGVSAAAAVAESVLYGPRAQDAET